MIPSKSPYSMGWSSTCTARRLSAGSREGPLGTAHDFNTPSISSRRSKWRRGGAGGGAGEPRPGAGGGAPAGAGGGGGGRGGGGGVGGGRGGGGGGGDPRGRRPAAAPLRDRGLGRVGRRPSVRGRDGCVRREVRAVSIQGEFARLAREGERATLVTVVRSDDGPAVGTRLLVRADGSVEGSLGDTSLDDAARRHSEELMWGTERSELREENGVGLFVDVAAPSPRIFIFGAVDFALALCRTARVTGWRPYVIDPRSRLATPERFPAAQDVVA